MEQEAKDTLNRIAAQTAQIHTFVFGVDGQGGMHRALEQHKQNDLEQFSLLTTTLQTTRTELSVVRDDVHTIQTSWKAGMAIAGLFFTAIGAGLHLIIDWFKHK